MQGKSEIRNSKTERNLKFQNRNPKKGPFPRILNFEFWTLDFLRIADCRLQISCWSVFQVVLFLVSIVQFLRCAGPAYVWVFVGLIIPVLRLSWSANYRRRVWSQIRLEWSSIETFASNPSLCGGGNKVGLPWRATVLLIVLPAGLFFLTQGRPLMAGDSKPITLTASALVCGGTTDLSAFVPEYASVYRPTPSASLPYFCMQTATGIYSSYPSGMFVFAVPSAALARLLGADLSSGGVQDRMEKGVACWLAAACLGLFFLLALHLVDAASAAWMTLFLATGSGLCSTVAQALWQHGGVLFWMLLALLVEFRIFVAHNDEFRMPQERRGYLSAFCILHSALQGVALAMMFACRLPSAIIIAAFGIWLLVRAPRRAVLVGFIAVIAYIPWAWYYGMTYGHLLGPSIRQREMFTGNWRETLIPLLFSTDHGLLVYQPWIFLGLAIAVPGVRRQLPAISRDAPGGWTCFCLAVIVPYMALIASWYCWWGGQCWGSRLLVETVPFFALLCLPSVAGLRRLIWGRRLLLATALIAAFVQLTGVYLKADFRDTQPALIGSTDAEPPGSWKHWPFLTPFVGAHMNHGLHG